MSYYYKDERPKIFTEQGQIDFIKVRDKAKELLEIAGAFEMFKVLKGTTGAFCDTWYMMALVDRLVELGEFVEVTTNARCQNRVFVKAVVAAKNENKSFI